MYRRSATAKPSATACATGANIALILLTLFGSPVSQAADGPVTQIASFRFEPVREVEVIQIVTALTAAVKANEPGVLTYIAHTSSAEPGLITFYEIYANEKALENHGQQPHLQMLSNGFRNGLFQPWSSDTTVKIERLDQVSGFSR